MTQQKQNGNLVAIITMFFIFAMISFVTNLAAPFGTIWRNEYAGSNTLGMMGNMMNFWHICLWEFLPVTCSLRSVTKRLH